MYTNDSSLWQCKLYVNICGGSLAVEGVPNDSGVDKSDNFQACRFDFFVNYRHEGHIFIQNMQSFVGFLLNTKCAHLK